MKTAHGLVAPRSGLGFIVYFGGHASELTRGCASARAGLRVSRKRVGKSGVEVLEGSVGPPAWTLGLYYRPSFHRFGSLSCHNSPNAAFIHAAL